VLWDCWGVDAISTPFVRPPTGAPPKELSHSTGSGKRLVGGHCPLDLLAEKREEWLQILGSFV
jgi:hypothetical protein